MSIIESQIKKLIGEASKKSLQLGRLLDISYISKLITEKVRKLDGGPILTLRKQYDSLSLNDINKMFEEILFDLEVLYESLVQRTADLFSIYNNSDLSYKAQRSQINYIKGIVNELLLATANAEDNFFGVTDNFNSLDKVDLNKSTSGMIDISEGVAILPFGMPSAIRIPMSHLIGTSNGTITSSTIKNEKVEARNGSGSKFGYAFSDISSIWRYEVISKDSNGVKIEVTIPLRLDNEVSRITRVELSIISGLSMSANVLWSLDDQNYKRFVGADSKTVLPNTEKIAWDFPETGVRFIRLQLTKYQPDSGYSSTSASISNEAISPVSVNTKSVNSYLYNFNISSIAFYRVGRSIDSILYSKPLAPFDAPDLPIASMALSVDEEVQPDTSIEYYLATADSNGNIKTDYTRVAPLEKPSSYVQSVLSFGNVIKDEVYFTGSYLNNTPSTHNSIDFYPIKTLSNEYKFGACSLYRGASLFSRNVNSNQVTKVVSDNYIDFSDGSRTKELYTFKTEIARPINRMIGSGSVTKTFLSLSSNIKRSASVKRNPITDPYYTDDPEPTYAIALVNHIRPNMRIENMPIKPTGGALTINGASIPIASSWMGYTSSAGSIGVPIIYNGQPIDIVNTGFVKPVLKYKVTAFEYVFRDGIDYTIKRSDDDYFQNFAGWNAYPLHWRIIPVEPTMVQILSGNVLTGQFNNQTGQFVLTGSNLPPVQFGSFNLLSDETLLLTFTIDSDITHRVSSVSYESKEVELDGLLSILDGDSISVTYRAVPSNIVRDSVKVTSNYGSNPSTVFTQGVDYSINTEDGTITKLQGGAITSLVSEVVYVDYSYKDTVDQTISFSTWCYVDSRDPIKFDFVPLTLKKSAGEYILWTYVDGGSQSKDISSYSSLTLARGWHYFVVKSLDPAQFNDCAITKVLKIKSVTNDYLFLPVDRGGRVFTKMTAYRAPMKQVSYTLLRNGILKSDHSKFAIEDSTKRIFVNFRPSDTEDLYYYRVTSNGVLQLVNFEEFTFIGTRRVDSDFAGTHVLFKARLSRADGSDGGITPKLGSYNIRISY